MMFVAWLVVVSVATQLSSAVKIIDGGLTRYGENVCEHKSVNTESYKIAQVTHYTTSDKTKCRLFNWWRCDVKRQVTKTIYLIRTRDVEVISLVCCEGWKKENSNSKVCEEPYCEVGCKNGKCSGGNKCQCKPGWTGQVCGKDVNECHHNNGGCQQACTNTPGSFACGCYKGYELDKQDRTQCKDVNECDRLQCTCANQQSSDCGAICTNTIGSFKCSCDKGYNLVGPTVCQDIDECLSKETNSCPSKCINFPGTYSCDCMRGFRLAKDKITCQDINECALLNGTCQHRCLNTYGSYVCQCRLGFRLHHDRRKCIDVNECQSFHGCEMQCNNTFGSYYCSCPRGYVLNDDKFTCRDIDECSIHKVKGLAGNTTLSDCEQLCRNTAGSFKCTCKRGFLLRTDGKTCKDTDECSSGTHKCAHKCTNTYGSYVCSCRTGYKLTADRRSCRPLPCESIESPFHGSLKCTGDYTGSICLFTCDPGYQLLGSSRRVCLPSSKWNGTKTTCKAKSCSEIESPDNAVVLLPCHKTYKSKCSLQCIDGYYNKIGDTGTATCSIGNHGNLEWNLNQFKCEKLQICQPNPCKNKGKCVIDGKRYICDCEGTGYEGSECQTGIITTPVFDKLEMNQQSRTFYLHAQPKNELIVTLKAPKSLTIKPKRELVISKISKKVSFSVVPLKAGLYEISYSLSGQDAKNYKVPEVSSVYVKAKKSENVYKLLQIPDKTLPIGCHNYTLPKDVLECRTTLTSSHSWDSVSSSFSIMQTRGIAHLKTKQTIVPFSIFGTGRKTLVSTKPDILNMIHKLSTQHIKSSIWINKNGKCEVFSLSSDNLLELIQTDAFPNTMLASLTQLMPKWIQLNTDKSNNLFDVSNILVSVGKPPSTGPGSCENLPVSSTRRTIYYKPSLTFKAHLNNEMRKFGSYEPACFAVDVCKDIAFVDFSQKARKSFEQMTTIQNMKTAGWDLSVSSFGLGKQGFGDSNYYNIWMKGDYQVYLKTSRLTVGMNLTGETTAALECLNELFSKQFTCPISGNIEGKVLVKTTIQMDNSKRASFHFKTDTSTGVFYFGGPNNGKNVVLSERCGKSQGVRITMQAKTNPFQGSILSHYILPYLQQSMNISVYHTIGGGGQTGIKVPVDMQMKLMILGFTVKAIQPMLKGALGAVPQYDSDILQLQKIVSKLDSLATEATQTLNTKRIEGKTGEEFKIAISSIGSLIKKIDKFSNDLSKKLSKHKSNFQIQSLLASLQSFDQNTLTILPLKLDIMRSPVEQKLNGLVVNTPAQICLGQLCIPDVKVVLDAPGEARTPRCENVTNLSNPSFLRITAFPNKPTKLGNILSIHDNQPIDISLFPRFFNFEGIFDMFGMSKEARVDMTDKQLNAKMRGHLFGKYKCQVRLTADSNVEDWRNIVFKAKGEMDDSSTLTKMLEDHLNKYALNLIEKSEKRVETAKLAYENITSKLQQAKHFLNSSKNIYNDLKQNQTELKMTFKRKKAYYSAAIAWFEDALKQYNISTFNTKTCQLTQCKRICNKTCVHDICWKKTNVSYQTEDCEYKSTLLAKILPVTKTSKVQYTTRPTLRIDMTKCKNKATRFFENFLTLGMYNGKRRKRSIDEIMDEDHKLRLDINEYLRVRNTSLGSSFDINAELRKTIPNLPKAFDFNESLNSYILKQYSFDINKILRERFPALPSDFDIDREIVSAYPALKHSFSFDMFLKKIVLQSAKLKVPVNLEEELAKLSPRLARDFDKVLKRAVPELEVIGSVVKIIQKHLNNIMEASFDPALLKTFDINHILKSNIRGFPETFDINKVLQAEFPLLGSTFDLNNIISNSSLGLGAYVHDIDQLLSKVTGNPGLSLANILSRAFPGFDRQFNLKELIKNKMVIMLSVKVNKTTIHTLGFNTIMQTILPTLKKIDIDAILTKAFPVLKPKFNLHDVLRDAIPLMKALGELDLNQLLTGLIPNTTQINIDLDKVLKHRNPALRGDQDIERFISERLKEVALPNLEKIMSANQTLSKASLLRVQRALEEVIGRNGIADLRNLIHYSVFPNSQRGSSSVVKLATGGVLHRPKRILPALALAGGLLVGYSLLVSTIKTIVTPRCVQRFEEKKGDTEIHEYTQVKTFMESKKISISKWICENARTVNMTSNAYEPSTCCRKDIPCVEFLDPKCVINNRVCLNQREEQFRQSQSIFNATLFHPYYKLLSSEKDVSEVALQMEGNRLRRQLAFQNVQIVKARANQLAAMKNTSRIVYEKMKSIPQVELGFKVKHIAEKSLTRRPFKVTDLSFSTVSSTLSKTRLPFQAKIQTKGSRDVTLDFIIDFEKINSSLNQATEKAIRLYTSSPSRKKRSVEPNTTRQEDSTVSSCLLANNVSMYFSDILASLDLAVESYDEQKRKMVNEINDLDNAVSAMKANSTDDPKDSFVKRLAHVLSNYRNEKEMQTEISSWNETVVTWKNFVENVTDMRQFTNCSGSLDCVEELNERLAKNYLSLGNKSDVLGMISMLDELTSGLKELLGDDVTEERVKTLLHQLLVLSNKTRDKNFLCSDEPQMLTTASKAVKLLYGESLTLHCKASSKSKVKYLWRRDKTLLQSSKNGTFVIKNVQATDEGLYRCEAKNNKGSGFSGTTTIIIETKPQILEHPESVQVPLNKDSRESFSCVGTGKPLPKITWLYRPPSSNFSIVLHNENGNILSIAPDNVDKSGYYYCEVSNTRGVAVSREARLDVLSVSPASPKTAILFNATKYCNVKPCQDKRPIPFYLSTTLRDNVVSMVAKSLNVSQGSIKSLRYWQRTRKLGQIAMYVSSPLNANSDGKASSIDQMAKHFSEARMSLFGHLKRLLRAVNRTVLMADNASAPLIGLVDTLGYLHIEPDCPSGQWLHEDGYYCVQCPPGSYKLGPEGRCISCQVGTYQPEPGRADCLPCGRQETTLQEGAIHASGCIKKAVCPPGLFASSINKCDKCPVKTYQPLAGQTSCLPCPSGIALQTGQLSCRRGPGVPERFTAKVSSSTAVVFHWRKPSQTREVVHYELEYGYPGSSPLRTVKIKVPKDAGTLVWYGVRGLDKYTIYSAKVYAVLRGQRGKPAKASFRTKEDVPERPPTITSVKAINTTAIEVKWKELPMKERNGIIIHYTVLVKENAVPKYFKKQVDGRQRSVVITGLSKHTFYCVVMTAATAVGPSHNWQSNLCTVVATKKSYM